MMYGNLALTCIHFLSRNILKFPPSRLQRKPDITLYVFDPSESNGGGQNRQFPVVFKLQLLEKLPLLDYFRYIQLILDRIFVQIRYYFEKFVNQTLIQISLNDRSTIFIFGQKQFINLKINISSQFDTCLLTQFLK